MTLKPCCNTTCTSQVFTWDTPYCSDECRKWLAAYKDAETRMIQGTTDAATILITRQSRPGDITYEDVTAFISKYGTRGQPGPIELTQWQLDVIKRYFPASTSEPGTGLAGVPVTLIPMRPEAKTQRPIGYDVSRYWPEPASRPGWFKRLFPRAWRRST